MVQAESTSYACRVNNVATPDAAARLDAAMKSYERRFNRPAPMPAFVGEEDVATVLEAAVRRGRPVPKDFDWYWWLPPGALA